MSERVLVAGWFSFSDGHATAGDLYSRDLIVSWLQEVGCLVTVAGAPPFMDGVVWQKARPTDFDRIVFVCGPFHDGMLEKSFLDHFDGLPVVGINLSMIQPLARFNPFQQLWERDSNRTTHADVVFGASTSLVPVIGVCLVEDYPAGRTKIANAAIRKLLSTREAAIINIDTRLDENSTGLRTPAEIESIIARVNVLITTRLHGLVMAIKNGVPALAIDPEPGGFKIKRQAERIGWPIVFVVDQLPEEGLQRGLDYCLTPEGLASAQASAKIAREDVQQIKAEFQAHFLPRSS